MNINSSNVLIAVCNKLLKMGLGDRTRINMIKARAEQGRIVPQLDRKYIEKLAEYAKLTPEPQPISEQSPSDLTITTDSEPKISTNVNKFCTSCGARYTVGSNFCPSCGHSIVSTFDDSKFKYVNTSKNTNYDSLHTTKNVNSDNLHTTVRRSTYKTLTLIGGIFGIVVTPIVAISMGMLLAIGSAFDPTGGLSGEDNANLAWMGIITSIAVSIIGIVCVYTINKPKAIGILLIFLGIVEMIGTAFISGLITYVLFIVAGIVALNESRK